MIKDDVTAAHNRPLLSWNENPFRFYFNLTHIFNQVQVASEKGNLLCTNLFLYLCSSKF